MAFKVSEIARMAAKLQQLGVLEVDVQRGGQLGEQAIFTTTDGREVTLFSDGTSPRLTSKNVSQLP